MPGADKQGGTLVLGFYQEPELLNSLIRTQTVASWAGDFFESGLDRWLRRTASTMPSWPKKCPPCRTAASRRMA